MKYAVICAVLLLFVAFSPAFGSLESDEKLLMERVKEAKQKENLEKAFGFLEQILEINPDSTDAKIEMGKIFVQIGEHERAKKIFDKILDDDKQNKDALIENAKILLQNGKQAESEKLVNRVLEIENQNVDATALKGDIYFQRGETEKARESYVSVLKIDQFHKDSGGVPYFQKLLEIDPENVDALNAKGSSLVYLGRSPAGSTIIVMDKLDESISYFDKVLENDPENVDALFNKGRALVQMDKKQEGMSLVNKALSLDPGNTDIQSYIADDMVRQNNLEEAQVIVDEILRKDPDHVDALFNKGSILARQMKYEDAFSVFSKIIKENPQHNLAAKNLSLMSSKLGKVNLDGYMEAIVRNADGNLVMHVKIPKVTILNHTMGKEFVNSWPVTGTIERDGRQFHVAQYELVKDVHVGNIYGGANHYGIPHDNVIDVHILYANYWQYIVKSGDTVKFVYSVFKPV